MQYLLQNCFSEDLPARRAYIYDTLSLWTVQHPPLDGFVLLKSMPENALDILFIVGHDHRIFSYLTNHKISERQIVSITCLNNFDVSKLKLLGKKLYLPKQDKQKSAPLLIGKEFEFDFDLTESEILFYNNRQNPNITERLESAFDKII